MKLNVVKRGFNYSQDGRGNRLVVHLQGCNFRCPWCSNPEGMSVSGEYFTDSRGFKRFSCAELEVEALVDEAERAKMLFFDGGGVTFSGGEPTLQFEPLKAALALLKDAGIHTCIETNASHPRLSELFPLLDQLIMDFKHFDRARHREFVGADNVLVCENLRRAGEHPDLRVRTVLVHGFNDGPEDPVGYVGRFRELLAGAKKLPAFEFLAYHEYGRVKWEQCGKPYGVTEGFVAPGTVERFEEAFRSAGLPVVRS